MNKPSVTLANGDISAVGHGSLSGSLGLSLKVSVVLALALTGTLAGCDCEESTQKAVTTLQFVEPTDGASLSLLDDNNNTLEGLQPTITLKTTNVSGAQLELSARVDPNATDPDESVTIEIPAAGTYSFNTGAGQTFTVPGGQGVELRADLLDASGGLLISTSITVDVDAGGVELPFVSITSPQDNAVLSAAQDADAATPGFQLSLTGRLENVADGDKLEVFVNNAPEAVATASADGSNAFTFEGITLEPTPGSSWDIAVEATTETGESARDSITVSFAEVTCSATLAPAAVAGGRCDFTAASTDLDPDTDGFQTQFVASTDCDDLQLELNGVLGDALPISNGESTVLVTLTEGTNTLRLLGSTPDFLYESAPLLYVVDTIPPETSFLNLTPGQRIDPSQDANGMAEDGIQLATVTASTSGADGDSPSAILSLDGAIVDGGDPADDGVVTFRNVGFTTEGDHDVTVEVSDACGNTATDTVTVNVVFDADATLALLAPADGTAFGPEADEDPVTAGLQTTFTAELTGFIAGTELRVECRRPTAQVFFSRGAATASDASTLDIPVSLPEGTWLCRAASDAPSLTSAVIQVTVSINLPTIAISYPDDQGLFAASPIEVSAITANANGRMATLTANSDVYGPRGIVAEGVSFANVVLTEGSNTLTVMINDTTASDTVTVVLDTTAPTLSFASPALTDGVVTIDELSGSLANGITIDVALAVGGVPPGTAVCLRVGNRAPICGVTDTAGNVTLTGVQLTPGAQTLTATSTDLAGNIGTASMAITVALDLPRLEITSPTDGASLISDTIDVVVDSDLVAGSTVELFVNDANTAAASTTVDANGDATFTGVALAADNLIWVRGTDPRGTGLSPRISVTVDTTAPVVSFVSPADGKVYNRSDTDTDGTAGFQTTITLRADGVEDGQPGTLTVDCGAGPQTANATFTGGLAIFRRVTLADQASCSLTGTATDLANNQGSTTINVRVDRIAPTLGFRRLRDGLFLGLNFDADAAQPGIQFSPRVDYAGLEAGQTIHLTGTTDTGDIVIDLTSDPIVDVNGDVLFAIITLPDGPLEMRASAQDLAGNGATALANVVVDASPIQLRILQPDNDAQLGLDEGLPELDAPRGLRISARVLGVAALADQSIALCADTAPANAPACQTSGAREIARGTLDNDAFSVAFDQVFLPEGNSNVVAETTVPPDNTTFVISNPVRVRVDTFRPTCNFQFLSDDEPFGIVNKSEDENPGTAIFRGRFRATCTEIEAAQNIRMFVDANQQPSSTIPLDAALTAEWEFNFPEGDHTVRIASCDRAGNCLEPLPQVAFTVDTVAPTLAFANLAANELVNATRDGDLNTPGLQLAGGVDASCSAIGRDVTLIQVVGALDSVDPSQPDLVLGTATVQADGFATFDPTTTIPDGASTLALRASDRAGNVTTVTRNIVVDVTPPTVTITAPASNQTITAEDPAFRGRPGFQVAVVVDCSEPGRPVLLEDLSTDTVVGDDTLCGANGTATIVATLSRGTSILVATVEDAAANTASSDSVTLTVDIPGCGIAFTEPTGSPLYIAVDDDNDPSNGVHLTFRAAIGDIDGCLGQTASLYLNNVVVATATPDGTGGLTFADIVLANPGRYDIFATILDTAMPANESSTNVITAYVDLIPPTLAITTPADPAHLGQAADLSPSAGLTICLDLQTTNAIGGTFTVESSLRGAPITSNVAVTANAQQLCNLTFPEGQQTITVTVTDLARSTAQAALSLEADLTPPATVNLAGSITNRRLGAADLVWIATADDGAAGTAATRYEVRRFATAPTDLDAFRLGTLVTEVVDPVNPGSEAAANVASLPFTPPNNNPRQDHFVAVVAFDNVGNASAVSNAFQITLEIRESVISRALANFGLTAVGVGDVNNDGFDDLVVGAYTANQLFLLYGQADLAALNGTAPTMTQLTFAVGGQFGISVAPLGDVNGDGFDDFAVGAAPFNSGPGNVYVYLGADNTPLTGAPDVRITGPTIAPAGLFGYGISSAGNFADTAAGESLPDILIGGPALAGSANQSATIVLGRDTWVRGSLTTLTVSTTEATNRTNNVVRITSALGAGDFFGLSVASVGDLNGNGYDDIAVSAPDYYGGGDGDVFIFHGDTLANLGAAITSNDGDRLTIPVTGAECGTAIAAGDINLDDIPDIVANCPVSAQGDRILTWFLDDPVDPAVDLNWRYSVGARYGDQLSILDVNGDGLNDLLVGSTVGTTDAVAIYLNNNGTLPSTANITFLGRGQGWGNEATSAGDLNGDGLADFVVGQTDAQQVYIMY